MINTESKNKLTFHVFFLLVYSFTVFIMIIKFGIPVGLPEVNSFPSNIAEWLIFSWPPILFSSIAALLLLINILHLLIKVRKTDIPNKVYKFQIPGLWLLFTLFSLLGFINAVCFDIPYMQCFYFAGITAFATSLYYLKELYSSEDLHKYLLGAVFWASVIIVLYGLYQYLYGFNNTRAYLFSSLEKQISPTGNFYSRLMQNYIYSTFSLTNTLAGFLILTTPISVWYAYTYTQTKFLKLFFPIVVFSFFLIALFLTGSRSAIIALSISIFFIFVSLQFSKKIKYTAIFFTLCTAVSSILYLSIKGAASASILVRLDYYTVALKLFIKNFFTGSGWGSFFYSFGFMKSYPSPEAAHTPHNFILSVTSQSGIISGILIFIIFILPIILLYKKLKRKKTEGSMRYTFLKNSDFYLLCGAIALFIHMLLDVDFQIPSILLTATLLNMLAMTDKPCEAHTDNNVLKINKRSALPRNVMITVSVLLIIIISLVSIQIIPARYKLQKLYSECFPMPYVKSDSINKEQQRNRIKQLFSESVKAQPYSPFPWVITGEYCIINRNWADAEYCYSNAILRSPQRASYYYSLYIAQAYQKKVAKALKNLNKAKELFPELYESKYNNFIKQLKEAGYSQS